jgi:FKBP-type peptidyl-prolyl cis-trans isomerase
MSNSKLYILLIYLFVLLSCKKENEIVGANEEEKIDNYIKSKSLTVTEKTTDGLRYIRTSPSANGVPLLKGQTVNVNYTGKFLSDKQFDKGNFSFRLGGGQVVAGFDIGIAKMKTGEKATIIFPSSLGYGPNDYSSIPGGSSLVFDIEVVSAQ